MKKYISIKSNSRDVDVLVFEEGCDSIMLGRGLQGRYDTGKIE